MILTFPRRYLGCTESKNAWQAIAEADRAVAEQKRAHATRNAFKDWQLRRARALTTVLTYTTSSGHVASGQGGGDNTLIVREIRARVEGNIGASPHKKSKTLLPLPKCSSPNVGAADESLALKNGAELL
jgi:hypothetical protein